MAVSKFDVLVIGGGPGGYEAAIKASLMGKKTAIAEKEKLGGVCLNWGCIPTKSLLRNAEIVRDCSRGDVFGFEIAGLKTDYAKAYERSRSVSEKLVSGVEYLMKKNKITVFKDAAVFTGNRAVKLKKSGETVLTDHVIIAAGSRPAHLPFLDYGQENILDSKKALQLKKVPESILVIGAGAIGMEFATIFSAYGAKVTVVEMLPAVLPNEDAEISAFIGGMYKKRGISIHTGTKVTRVENDGTKAVVHLAKNGTAFTVRSEYVLAATGILPNSEALGLELAGIKKDGKGFIVTDGNMCTNVPGVYAIGDITGKCALAHAASAQGMVAVAHLCGCELAEIDYANIPKCTYGYPECASAGLTKAQAQERGFDSAEAVFPFSANGKALAYGEGEGLAKLVYDKKYGQLLGMHMAGVHVTEMIWGIAGYLGVEMTVEEMARIVHPHPTVSETILEAAHIACGEPINC